MIDFDFFYVGGMLSLWRISAEYVKVGGMTVNLTGSCSCFTLLSCALAVNACGMELDEQFRAPPPNAARPCIALAADREGLLGEGVGRQLERARDIGAGGVLLAVPTADEAVWEGVTRALDRARQLGLEAGLTDFFISQNEAESAPRAKKWVWSAETVRPDSDGVSRMTPRVATPPDSYRSVTCQAVPVGVTDLHPHHLVDLSAQSLPTGGVWRVYRFGVVDAEPPQIDPYDGTAFFRHVNQWLFACQSRMKQTYGSTLLWVLLPGLSRTDMAWTVDLPEMFLKRSGLGLNRYLPAWTGVAVGGEATAAFVRQRMAQTVCALWRERCGKTVDELVHEAGLEAGIRIDQAPVDPVEVAWRFRRPVLVGASRSAAREANARAAGGARTLGRRVVMGWLAPHEVEPSPAAVLMPFPWRHALDGLYADGATRLLLDVGGALPSDDTAFRSLRDGCLYAHRCQLLLQQGVPVGDLVVWAESPLPVLAGYSADAVNGVMLGAASVKNGRILFESEREYTGLAVAEPLLRHDENERLVRMLAARGVRVWLLTEAAADGNASAAVRLTQTAGGDVARVPARCSDPLPGITPDMVWRTDTAGFQVRFVHRRSATHEVYFLVNEHTEPGRVTCVFRDTGKGVPERWDPLTGEIGRVETDVRREADGRVTASIFLGAQEACFIVFGR